MKISPVVEGMVSAYRDYISKRLQELLEESESDTRRFNSQIREIAKLHKAHPEKVLEAVVLIANNDTDIMESVTLLKQILKIADSKLVKE